jgi:serine acetyltransferase
MRIIVPILFVYRKLISIYKNIQACYYSYKYYGTGKIYRLNDFTIGIKTLGEKKTRFPHPLGIVIGRYVEIGWHCMIYQNVTIGAKSEKDGRDKKYPKIGNNVCIFAHVVIIGDITIGDNAVIGANTFVNKDVPKNAIVTDKFVKIVE